MLAGKRKALALSVVALLVQFPISTGDLAAAEPSKAEPTPAATGQLIIEGQGIERLTLEKKDPHALLNPTNLPTSNTVVVNKPGQSVSLPSGEYWRQRVELRGGYYCPSSRAFRSAPTGIKQVGESLTIGPEKPCLLKIGGPLKPTVIAHRPGRTLGIAYQLLDGNGRRYFRQGEESPPRFAVYHNDRVIGSASFEYG